MSLTLPGIVEGIGIEVRGGEPAVSRGEPGASVVREDLVIVDPTPGFLVGENPIDSHD